MIRCGSQAARTNNNWAIKSERTWLPIRGSLEIGWNKVSMHTLDKATQCGVNLYGSKEEERGKNHSKLVGPSNMTSVIVPQNVSNQKQ